MPCWSGFPTKPTAHLNQEADPGGEQVRSADAARIKRQTQGDQEGDHRPTKKQTQAMVEKK